MKKDWRISNRILHIKKSAIHEMTRLSKQIEDVYLYCYCGKPICPRFILMDIIKKI